jgi:glycosyltransferase involved in cell wall biosynthesis
MLLALESHPVQYRAPVFRELAQQRPGRLLVIYLSDCSVRGHRDAGFGIQMRWNTPLLSGYPFRVLNNERGVPLSGFRSLHGKGLFGLLLQMRPEAVLFSQFAYQFEWTAYLACLLLGIPIWLRTETQDEAFARSTPKEICRSLIYRIVYAPIARVFYIGELNRRHYLAHDVPPRKLTPARYCVPDPWAAMTAEEMLSRRSKLRADLGIGEDICLVAFVGKLTQKKNPGLLLRAWRELPREIAGRVRLIFVGSGELEESLRKFAAEANLPVTFAGFINQAELPDYYLAADVLVLPSNRAGETWGLVVNEGLLAGCAVIVTDAVGCHREFGTWERVRVIPEDCPSACANAISDLLGFPRVFDWCRQAMHAYSIDAAAAGIAQWLR